MVFTTTTARVIVCEIMVKVVVSASCEVIIIYGVECNHMTVMTQSRGKRFLL